MTWHDRPVTAPAPRPTPPSPRTAGDEVHGWAGRVMQVLRWAMQLVAVNLLVIAGTLAGGVVLGLFPALDSGGRLLARLADADPSDRLWRDFWTGWAAAWRRLVLLGLPVVVAAAVLLVDAAVLRALDGPAAAALSAGSTVVAAWTLVVAAYVPAVARRYDEPWVRTWRFLVLLPALGPAAALAMLVTSTVLLLVWWFVPVLVPLVGVSVPLLATGLLADGQLERLDARAHAPT